MPRFANHYPNQFCLDEQDLNSKEKVVYKQIRFKCATVAVGFLFQNPRAASTTFLQTEDSSEKKHQIK